MFNVCPGCGEYSDDKTIEPCGEAISEYAFAVCQKCGHGHLFRRLPLLVVTGASGSGKTTMAMQLASGLDECVCLESDILWCDEFNKPDDDYRDYRNLWLRMTKNINQGGRPVVLFGSAAPGQFERCNESRYLSEIRYLALFCNQDEMIRRLRARPQWRRSGSDEVLERMVNFNRWLQENAESTSPPMTLLDTSALSEAASAAAVKDWIQEHLGVFRNRSHEPD